MLKVRIRDHVFQVAGALKALAAIVLTVGLALADWYDVVPMAPVLAQLFGDGAASKVALWLPIVFGTLRYVSTNRVHWNNGVDEGH